MQLYKLTDRDGQSYGDCQWGENVEHTDPCTGELCANDWLHAYTDPLLAILLNPIHAQYISPLLWEADGDVGKTDYGLQVSCTRLKTVRVMPLPTITIEQQVRCATFCARAVYDNTGFRTWADGWLSGQDRSAEAAIAAAEAAAMVAATVAAWSAWAAATARSAEAAKWAARAATWAATARAATIARAWAATVAARAARALEARSADRVAWEAAWEAVWAWETAVTETRAETRAVRAAMAAAWAVEAAAKSADLDLPALAREALGMAH